MAELEHLYKNIMSISDATHLEYQFNKDKQITLVESLMDHVTPNQSIKTLKMVTKLYIHFVTFGASDDIQQDAFTCMMMMKSFSCRQQIIELQDLCFKLYFHLLYSRSLTDEQKHDLMLEFSEFGLSEHHQILVKFLCFYFDTKSNESFNLFNHSFDMISFDTIQHFCKAFEVVISENIKVFPVLKPEILPITFDTVQQRFFNQFVYGKFGLYRDSYSSDVVRLIINCMYNCSLLNSASSVKALIKSTDYLINKLHSAESKDNVDLLVVLDQDVKFIMSLVQDFNFGKLTHQWKRCVDKLKN